jgi:hypothetical protein
MAANSILINIKNKKGVNRSGWQSEVRYLVQRMENVK